MENDKLKSIVIEYSKTVDNIDEIRDNDKLYSDLNIDSLSFIEMAIDIEECFNVDLKVNKKLFSKDLTYRELLDNLNIILNNN